MVGEVGAPIKLRSRGWSVKPEDLPPGLPGVTSSTSRQLLQIVTLRSQP